MGALMELSRQELTDLWEASLTFSQTARRFFRDRILPEDTADGIADKDYAANRKLNVALSEGRYFAIGFAEPKRFGDLAHLIPPDAWSPDPTGFRIIDWPDVLERWTYDDFVFCDVRIATSAKHLAKTGGRDSHKPFFEDAISRMVSDGRIDISKSQTSHFDSVRNLAADLYPMHKDKILKANDRTVGKYLSPFFNRLQKHKE